MCFSLLYISLHKILFHFLCFYCNFTFLITFHRLLSSLRDIFKCNKNIANTMNIM